MGVIDTYATTNQDTYVQCGPGTGRNFSYQSFTGDGEVITSAQLYLWNGASSGAGITASVEIRNHSGTYGTSSVPIGTALVSSSGVDMSTVSTGSFVLVTFTFLTSMVAVNGVKYCLVFNANNTGVSILLGIDASSPTHGGNGGSSTTGTSWTADNTYDTIFALNGTTAPTGNGLALFK